MIYFDLPIFKEGIESPNLGFRLYFSRQKFFEAMGGGEEMGGNFK